MCRSCKALRLRRSDAVRATLEVARPQRVEFGDLRGARLSIRRDIIVTDMLPAGRMDRRERHALASEGGEAADEEGLQRAERVRVGPEEWREGKENALLRSGGRNTEWRESARKMSGCLQGLRSPSIFPPDIVISGARKEVTRSGARKINGPWDADIFAAVPLRVKGLVEQQTENHDIVNEHGLPWDGDHCRGSGIRERASIWKNVYTRRNNAHISWICDVTTRLASLRDAPFPAGRPLRRRIKSDGFRRVKPERTHNGDGQKDCPDPKHA
ncbi:hypothetical protein C8J57DRAFT_1234466 [Mycena rebaudengoi]|nr:hypothetical protein C8J57DRAFT_1234466 [Mycena rebaudengoi]